MSKITIEQKVAFADQILNELIDNEYLTINTSQGIRPYFADEKELRESDLAMKVIKALYDNNISEID